MQSLMLIMMKASTLNHRIGYFSSLIALSMVAFIIMTISRKK
jgi:hypothetical protein